MDKSAPLTHRNHSDTVISWSNCQQGQPDRYINKKFISHTFKQLNGWKWHFDTALSQWQCDFFILWPKEEQVRMYLHIFESKWFSIVNLSYQCDCCNFCNLAKNIHLQKIRNHNMCDSCNLCDFIIRESKWSCINNLTNTCDWCNLCDFSKKYSS